MKRIIITEQQFKQIIAKNLLREYSFNHTDWVGKGNMAEDLQEAIWNDYKNQFIQMANNDEIAAEEILKQLFDYIQENEYAFEITNYGSTDYEPETNGYSDNVFDGSQGFSHIEKILKAAPVPPEYVELTIRIAKEIYDNFDNFKYEEDEPDYDED